MITLWTENGTDSWGNPTFHSLTIGDNLLAALGESGTQAHRMLSTAAYATAVDRADMLQSDGCKRYTFADLQVGKGHGDRVYVSLTGRTAAYTGDMSLPLWSKTAQSVRVGRFLQSLFTPDVLARYGMTIPLTDSEGKRWTGLERVSDACKRYTDPGYTISVVSGLDIAKVYSGDMEYTGSCMQGLNIDRFDLYSNCPDCQLIVVKTDDQIVIGRALLWSNVRAYNSGDRLLDTFTYRDRYYTSRQHTRALLQNWQRDQGIVHDYDHDTPGSYLSVSTGVEYKHEEYPYMDTFCYVTSDWKTITTQYQDYGLTSTHGLVEGYQTGEECWQCGEYYDEDSMYDFTGRLYCADCYLNLPTCDQCCETQLTRDLTFSELADQTLCLSCLSDRRDELAIPCQHGDCQRYGYSSADMTLVYGTGSDPIRVCHACAWTQYRYNHDFGGYTPASQPVLTGLDTGVTHW